MTLRELDIKYANHVFSNKRENDKDMKQFFREFRIALFSECMKRHLVCKCVLGNYFISGSICDRSGICVKFEIPRIREHARLYTFQARFRKDCDSPYQYCVLQHLPQKFEQYVYSCRKRGKFHVKQK